MSTTVELCEESKPTVVKVGRKSISALPDLYIKVGAKGKPLPASEIYAALGKGEARRVRKALRRAGLAKHAACPASRASSHPEAHQNRELEIFVFTSGRKIG